MGKEEEANISQQGIGIMANGKFGMRNLPRMGTLILQKILLIFCD